MATFGWHSNWKQNANASAASASDAASVSETMKEINRVCKAKGGVYKEYSCKTVSWDDASRGTTGGGLSCWGSNITDTYLKAKDGTRLFTVRPDNWNEKLGMLNTSSIALVAGNHVHKGGPLKPVTLKHFLSKMGTYGGYANMQSGADLTKADLDTKVSVRFQTTFLPVKDEEKAHLEFATEAYNYNTHSDSDPRNLVLLCTTQGVAVQQDGQGAKKSYHHAVDASGTVHRYWLEAERSTHKVGGAQKETAEERADALKRGKATASVIGTRALGTRFNVLMTVQIPLKQKEKRQSRGFGGGFGGGGMMADGEGASWGGGGGFGSSSGWKGSTSMACSASAAPMAKGSMGSFGSKKSKSKSRSRSAGRGRGRGAAPKKRGTANAARVSRGSEVDTWSGLTVKQPCERHPGEHITCTIVIYNTISGGIPTEADVAAAVDDMEALYAACPVSGHLADAEFDFMKKELTVDDMQDVVHKLGSQPVSDFGSFPMDETAAIPVATAAIPVATAVAQHNVTCDICRTRSIQGVRYKCLNCYDFDGCETCMNDHSAATHDRSHILLRLPSRNIQLETVLRPPLPVLPSTMGTRHEGVICDLCNRTVVGTRYKSATNKDWDCCGSCLAAMPLDSVPPLAVIRQPLKGIYDLSACLSYAFQDGHPYAKKPNKEHK